MGRRGERRHWGCAGAAAAGIARTSRVQSRFAEVADRPCVVVVGSGKSRFSRVQPRNARAVDEVWPANLIPSQSSMCGTVSDSGPGVGVVRISL